MKATKKFIESLLFFALSIVLLVASSLAWFASQNETDVDEVVQTVGKYDIHVVLEVKTSHAPIYDVIESVEELEALLAYSLPNDIYDFKLTITNQSSSAIDISIVFSNFISEPSIEGYNMLDVFYLVDGKVTIQDALGEALSQVTLDPISEIPVELDEYYLELYRFSNLVSTDRLTVLADYPLPYEATRVVLYTIQFDRNTENVAFEEAQFSINTIEIFMK
ncbi:MAG: hypothetical protein PHY42_02605 [Bacilli bacterium]|jgi:hypothetical protein|nr:hypothetical protein [Bacilli bacterium]